MRQVHYSQCHGSYGDDAAKLSTDKVKEAQRTVPTGSVRVRIVVEEADKHGAWKRLHGVESILKSLTPEQIAGDGDKLALWRYLNALQRVLLKDDGTYELERRPAAKATGERMPVTMLLRLLALAEGRAWVARPPLVELNRMRSLGLCEVNADTGRETLTDKGLRVIRKTLTTAMRTTKGATR